jgi:6,7-dimethyl-8-ribityllumazine synthase
VSEAPQARPHAADPEVEEAPAPEAPESESAAGAETDVEAGLAAAPEPAEEHAPGEFAVPDGVSVVEGSASGSARPVAIVVSRYNRAFTSRLLDRALDELDELGINRGLVTVMPVPGAFELPIAAMALAKTRRYACVIALGCVIRGQTPHFELVAGEAASGLQLAALETGIPVAFGVLTLEHADQADARIDRAADAVRSGLEMADVFGQLRAAAAGAV